MSNPNHSSMPNRRSRDLMNRLVPKQQIHNHPVTLGVTMGKNTKPIIRGSALGNSKVKKLPPLPDAPESIEKKDNDSDDIPEEFDYESLEDPFDFINEAKKRNDTRAFVYLHPSNILEDSEHPTCLKIIKTNDSKREEFWNLSLKGLTHVRTAAVDFIPLDEWLHDINLFSRIMKIPFFKYQRQWRSFKLWKKSVQSDKMSSARTSLSGELFFSHSVLRPAFIKIQRELNKLQQTKLFSIRPDGLYTLESFTTENAKHRENISKLFDDFFARTLQIVQDACEKTIDKLNSGEADHQVTEKVNPDASVLDQWIAQYNRAQKHGTGAQFDNNGPSLTFTKKASHHAVCQKLVRFIRLVDYVVISSLRQICFTSLLELFSIAKTLHDKGVEKIGYTDPDPIQPLILPNEYQKIFNIITVKTGEIFELPIFRIDVNFSEKLSWKPTEKDIVDRIDVVRNDFIDLLFKVPRLVVNPIFRQYIANDISSEKSGQEKMSTPDLGQIIFNDPIYKETMKKENEVISHAFDLLVFYSSEFKKAIDIYLENSRFDIAFLDSNEITATGVKEKIKEYHEQEAFLRTVVDKSEVGLFQIFLNQMKQLFIKSPGNCLSQIRQRIPNVTHRFLEEFTEKVQSAHAELTASIDDVASFVEYIHSVERQSDALPDLQRLSDVIRGFQALATEQNVYLSSDEQMNFQELLPVFDEVKRCLAFAEEQKANLMPKFTSILEKSISQLHSDVLDVTTMAADDRLSLTKTSPNEAATVLVVVIGKTDELHTLAKNYNYYQTSMSITATQFDDVEQLVSEVGLKQLLWETKTEWTNVTQQWFVQTFQTIDPSQMIGQLNDFQSRSMRAQMGLPNNEVADELRAAISDFSNLLPIVSDLKNPALNQTHMDQITNLLGGEIFGNEEFKFGRLVDLHAYNYVEQISSISAQATNEQSLQDMLNSVRSIIDGLQFVVNPCKFQKNTYTIEGTEGILAQLDDAQATINSVRSSRYVAPLRSKADELMKNVRTLQSIVNLLTRVQSNWSFINVIFQAGDVSRQLQNDAKELQSVDKTWRIVSTKLNDDPSIFFKLQNANIGSQTLPDLENAHITLEKIRKSLDEFIEQKRIAFPRLYFISNEELLDLIAKSKDPNSIQPYLPKLFDGIYSIELGLENHVPAVTAVFSINGERLNMRPIKFRNNVEAWLANIEEQSVRTLKTEIKNARTKFQEMVREDWISIQPSQIAYAITQTEWTSRVELCFTSANQMQSLMELNAEVEHKIANLIKITHLDLRDIERCKVASLIILDSHFRDIIKSLIDKNITDPNNYHYLKNFMMKWDDTAKEINITQFDSTYKYGYEFIGAQQRLVITPQYENCLSSLSITLSKYFGGCLIGPSGCGKTEMIRDIARTMGICCFLINCGPSITTLQMASVFRGIAQSGVWCCLQEFQRLSNETLNVADWHLNMIHQASVGGLKKFLFDSYEIPLNPSNCIFATISSTQPSAIPQPLKDYFRPISVAGVSERMITELTLLTLGFNDPPKLAKAFLRLIENCRNIIIKQPHYDFGIRTMKRILNNAGTLLHSDSIIEEEQVLSKAALNIMLPMFNVSDQQLFNSFLQELFPGDSLVSSRNIDMTNVLQDVCKKNNLQAMPYTLSKTEQLHKMSRVRPSIILVGQTGSGKTTAIELLKMTYDQLSQTNDDQFFPVNQSTICPNTLTFAELYGYQNLENGEYKSGIIETVFGAKTNSTRREEWIVFDGPINPGWIENMNTLLDGNQVLSLPNSKFIKLTSKMHIFFETPNLAQASPATLSRSSIICFEANQLSWYPLVQTLCKTMVFPVLQNKEHFVSHFNELINNSISVGIEFLIENADATLWSPLSICEGLIKIFLALVNGKEFKDNDGSTIMSSIYVFSFVWSFGGHLKHSRRVLFDSFIRDTFGGYSTLPSRGLIFDWAVDTDNGSWTHWSDHVPKFIDTASDEFELDPANTNHIFCHTIETYRIMFLLKLFLKSKTNVILSGQSGIGKTLVIHEVLKELENEPDFNHFDIEFSPKTTAQTAQKVIELYLEKKHGEYLRPICNKHSVLYIDKVNLGQSDSIELLRQILSLRGLCEKSTYKWFDIKKLSLLGVSGYNNGCSNPLPPRFLRHAMILEMIPFDTANSYQVVHSILQLFFRKFDDSIKSAEPRISNAILSVYESVVAAFPLSVDHPHFNFSFRDVSRVIHGLLCSSPETIPNAHKLERLWAHEINRVFSDRFNDLGDLRRFEEIVQNSIKKKLNSDQPQTAFNSYFAELPIDPATRSHTDVEIPAHNYIEYETIDEIIKALEEPAHEYLFYSKSSTNFPILLFDSCVTHIVKLLRIIQAKRGNAVLLGIPGTGKRTVTKFTAFLCQFDAIEFDNIFTLHEDFKSLCLKCGINGKNTILIINDEQMKNDRFMDDISSLMNGGDITTLFSPDDVDKMCTDIVFFAKSSGENESHQNLVKLFLERLRDSIHIVFCCSPFEFNMKNRFLNYPSILNYSTIDYYQPWPDTSFTMLAASQFEDDKISDLAVSIHQSVSESSHKLLAQYGRNFFVTPALFIQFINNYKKTLESRKASLEKKIADLDKSLEKISFTDSSIGSMESNLTDIEPQLNAKTQQAEFLSKEINETQALYDQLNSTILEMEAKAKEKMETVQKISEEAAKDLADVQPALENAVASLKGLNRGDITDLRGFQDPPPPVKTVMEVVCILAEAEINWKAACNILADPLFINKISSKYSEGRHVPSAILKKVQPYIETNPNFQESEVGRVSIAAKCLCVWGTALYNYEITYRKVEPKQQNIKQVNASLKKVREKLKKKNAQAKSLEDNLDELKQQFDLVNREKRKLNDSINESKSRVGHASKLAKILSADQKKWSELSKQLKDSQQYTQGDSFLCASFLTYFGPLPPSFRSELLISILKKVNDAQMKTTPGFTFPRIMAEPSEIQEWLNHGLPDDTTSIENAIIIRESVMSPLIIDSLGFANQFIKSFEKSRQIAIIKPNHPNFIKTIESNMRLGIPVLIEDVGECLDPAIDNVIAHRIISQDGKKIIKLNERSIEFDEKFKLYMTTKIPNPVYPPETFVTASIIDFSITKNALVAHEISSIVEIEDPELEKNKKAAVDSIVSAKSNLKQTEDRMLELLRTSGDHILDDEVLINTIESSENKRKEIEESLFKLETENERYTKERFKFTPVAERVAILFFALPPMSNLSSHYSYSLDFIQKVTIASLKQSLPNALPPPEAANADKKENKDEKKEDEKKEDGKKEENKIETTIESNNKEAANKDNKDKNNEERIPFLINLLTFSLFSEIARGILSKHRLTLSFIFTSAILRAEKKISESEWGIFMRGLPKIPSPLDNPVANIIPQELWDDINSLSRSVACYRTLPNKILSDNQQFIDFIKSDSLEIPEIFTTKCDDLQKLIFVKTVSPQKLPFFVKEFVVKNLGSDFIKPISPHIKIANAFTAPHIPLLLIVGSNEIDARQKVLIFASKSHMADKIKVRAISVSESSKAEKELYLAASRGEWILLEGLENGGKWTNDFCSIVSKVCSGSVHPDFRIFITTQYDSKLPDDVPAICVKMALERTDSIRTEVLRLIGLLEEDFFASESAIRIGFSISIYHSMILQRQKYGMIGFNSPYDFTDSDFLLVSKVVHPFLGNDPNYIPYEYLTFIFAEMIYGGHSIDISDRKILRAILSRIFCKESISGVGSSESQGGSLFMLPKVDTKKKLWQYIVSLPEIDSPYIFGLHENRQLSYDVKLAEQSGKSIEKATFNNVIDQDVINEIVIQKVKNITPSFPDLEDIGSANEDGETLNFTDPMIIILTHEALKLKQTIEIAKSSINEIEKVVRGILKPTEKSNEAILSIYKGEVPHFWRTFKCYLNLESWVKEIVKRVNFFNSWIRRGKPNIIDISCFAEPKAFFFALVSHHIKANQLKFDDVADMINFEVRILENEPETKAEVGVYIKGLEFQGSKFNLSQKILVEEENGELSSKCPILQIIPVMMNGSSLQSGNGFYQCPVYQISHDPIKTNRTKSSAELIVTLPIPTNKTEDFWILRGASLFLAHE